MTVFFKCIGVIYLNAVFPF